MNSGYLSLLRWSLSAQDARDGTAPSTATQMSAEDRAWLKEALESSMVDSITSMKLLVKVLQLPQGSERPVVEEKASALDDLAEYCENIDLARDLHKIGGLQPVVELLSSPYPSLRCRAANVLGTVVQNHPETQAWALELGALPRLVRLLEEALEQTDVVKGLFALACLARECDAATTAFVEKHGGFALLLNIAHGTTTSTRARRKSLFFLVFLFERLAPACFEADTLLALHALDVFEAVLASEQLGADAGVREYALQLILALARVDVVREALCGRVASVAASLEGHQERWSLEPGEEEAKLARAAAAALRGEAEVQEDEPLGSVAAETQREAPSTVWDESGRRMLVDDGRRGQRRAPGM